MLNEEAIRLLLTATNNYLDKDGLLYFKQKLDALYETKTNVAKSLNKKVDKEEGKGLSTNDYTTAEKEKLAGLEKYTLPTASPNVLGGVKIGTGLSVDSSGVLNATGGGEADSVQWTNVQGRPTKLSDFTNDSKFQTDTEVETKITSKGYQTSSQVEAAITAKGYQTSGEVDAKLLPYAKKTDIASVYKAKGNVNSYAELPTEGQQNGDVYNIKNADLSHGIKAGDNVVWTGTEWDNLAGMVDLSNYFTKTDFVSINNSEIDEMFRGV